MNRCPLPPDTVKHARQLFDDYKQNNPDDRLCSKFKMTNQVFEEYQRASFLHIRRDKETKNSITYIKYVFVFKWWRDVSFCCKVCGTTLNSGSTFDKNRLVDHCTEPKRGHQIVGTESIIDILIVTDI